jgi:hypothetical protein
VGRFYDTALLQQHPSLMCGDSTPSYLLHGPAVIPRLLATMPWRPQLVACLRDPVARAYSHYQVRSVAGRTKGNTNTNKQGHFEWAWKVALAFEKLCAELNCPKRFPSTYKLHRTLSASLLSLRSLRVFLASVHCCVRVGGGVRW